MKLKNKEANHVATRVTMSTLTRATKTDSSEMEEPMKRLFFVLTILMAFAIVLMACAAPAPPVADSPQDAPAAGEQLVIYMQMGGNQGDPSTLARTNGA